MQPVIHYVIPLVPLPPYPLQNVWWSPLSVSTSSDLRLSQSQGLQSITPIQPLPIGTCCRRTVSKTGFSIYRVLELPSNHSYKYDNTDSDEHSETRLYIHCLPVRFRNRILLYKVFNSSFCKINVQTISIVPACMAALYSNFYYYSLTSQNIYNWNSLDVKVAANSTI